MRTLLIHILDTQTGERAVYPERWEEAFIEDGVLDYLWRDGNNACDCNRALYLERALGREDESAWELPCGVWRFRVEKIIDTATGVVVYRDEDLKQPNPLK